MSNQQLTTLIVNMLNANGWHVSVSDNKIRVSTDNLVGTRMLCSIIDVDHKVVTLEDHHSWNHISWRSIDPIRGCLNQYQFNIISRTIWYL